MSLRRRLAPAVVGIALSGCAAYSGARHYADGTDALERGDYALAIAELERAAEAVPRASEVHNHLGLAYARAGRHGDALRAFRRAVAIDCRNAAASANLRAAEARAAGATGRERGLSHDARGVALGEEAAPR